MILSFFTRWRRITTNPCISICVALHNEKSATAISLRRTRIDVLTFARFRGALLNVGNAVYFVNINSHLRLSPKIEHGRAFYIISAQVRPKIVFVCVTQSAGTAGARGGGVADSPLARSASADTANSAHNINRHSFNLSVHIVSKLGPVERATSHLHTHSRTSTLHLRTTATVTRNAPAMRRDWHSMECNSRRSPQTRVNESATRNY